MPEPVPARRCRDGSPGIGVDSAGELGGGIRANHAEACPVGSAPRHIDGAGVPLRRISRSSEVEQEFQNASDLKPDLGVDNSQARDETDF